MKNNLLICSNCRRDIKWRGRGNGIAFNFTAMPVLGEIDEMGDIIIKRGGLFVKIRGSNFEVECGYCTNKIFYRERRDNVSGTIGTQLIHRIVFSQGSVGQGLSNGTSNEGTALLS